MEFAGFVEEALGNSSGVTPVMEFNWTNAKTFKIIFSKELKEAMALTKAGNASYKAGSFESAATSYKEALPKWNNLIKKLKAVPESSVGWLSLADWIVWTPFVNFVLPIIPLVANMVINSASDGYSTYSTGRYATPELTNKLNEAMQTKSYSKILIMEALVLCQDFTTTRIKECEDGGKHSAFESYQMTIAEGYANAVIECCEGAYDDMELPKGGVCEGSNSTISNGFQHMLEYVRNL